MTEISVLAGGWSVKGLDLSRLPGTVIGVNDSVVHARCHVAVSMDRLWTENRWANLQALKRIAYIRTAAIKNIGARPGWLRLFDCDHTLAELSDVDGVLNGTNSGLCALNLAYQMSRRGGRIYLFGFDMCRGPKGECYWYGEGYPWAKAGGGTGNTRYAEWAAQFDRAAEQCKASGIEVLNASKVSKITAFKKVDPREILAPVAA
jgi:hypothetical protein